MPLLAERINERFGFAYSCPRGWHETESMNADGCTLTDPSDSHTEIRVYASYAVLHRHLEEWVDWTVESERTAPGFTIVERTKTECLVQDSTERREPVPAERLVFRFAAAGLATVVIWTLTQFADVQYAIRCQAPVDRFEHYRDLFKDVVDRFRILSPPVQA